MACRFFINIISTRDAGGRDRDKNITAWWGSYSYTVQGREKKKHHKTKNNISHKTMKTNLRYPYLHKKIRFRPQQMSI